MRHTLPKNSFLQRLVLSLLVSALPALAFSAAPPVKPAAVEASVPTGRLIVGLREATVAEDPEPLARIHALADRSGVPLRLTHSVAPGMHVVHLLLPQQGEVLETTLAALRADPTVRFAQVDHWMTVANVPGDPLFTGTPGVAGSQTGQWYLQAATTTPDGSTVAALDAVTAWNSTTGSTNLVVADIDSGVRFEHPDLGYAAHGGRLLAGYDFVGPDTDGTFLTANNGHGWGTDPSDPGDWIDATDITHAVFAHCTIEDSSWHGTKVAGLIGAQANNGVGIAGVLWKGWVQPVRALGKCGGYESDVIAGMDWAAGITVQNAPANPYPANVINLSLGEVGSCSTALASATAAIIAQGIPIVAAAGNASTGPTAPGNCPGVIDVVALSHTGSKADYSNFLLTSATSPTVATAGGDCGSGSGDCLFALNTTTNAGTTVPTTSTYTDQVNAARGTSFASALTSGVVGLMRSVNANLTPAQIGYRLAENAAAYPTVTGTVPAVASSTPTPGPPCRAGSRSRSTRRPAPRRR